MNKTKKEVDKNIAKSIWLTKWNFQSFLNIPNQMKNFGSLIKLWEGSMQGEGFLRLVKPKTNSM